MARTTNRSVFDHHDTAIEEIVASCNGDMRGALRALLLVNEQLESELSQFHTATTCGSATEGDVKSSLH